MAPEHDTTPAPVCADCGLTILDNEDVTYTLDAAGNVTIALHADAFHRELVGDEDEGYVSPFTLADEQHLDYVRSRTIACDGVASSGNDCRMPAVYALTATDGHATNACEIHRDTLMLQVADTEGEFTLSHL